MSTRVLALDAYHGGSHQAFLDGWSSRSRHEFTTLTLPAYKWKWRMRHAAVTFAEQISRTDFQVRPDAGDGLGGSSCDGQDALFDVLFCTDMLNLAEFRGLCPAGIRSVPTIVYFHENQLTYPSRHESERDLHFAFTNVTTALAADRVWFNSAYHRDDFLDAVDRLIDRMPDNQPRGVTESIREKSEVHSPGVEAFPTRPARKTGPLRILWVSRWEHDKDPQTFFEALDVLLDRECEFRVSVLGESFGQMPACFEQARKRLKDHVDHWGFLPDRADYCQVLSAADVVVSTANHEFFGIAVLEAVAAGCFPLVPRRLAYPEILGEHPEFFYDGSVKGLVDRLLELADRVRTNRWPSDHDPAAKAAPFQWDSVVPQMDDAVELIRTG